MEKAKFKVGDIIKGTVRCRGIYSVTDERMRRAKIIELNRDYPDFIKVEILDHDDVDYVGVMLDVKSRYFDLVKEKPIVIYRKDNQVIALDQSTGKKAIATCCPEDEFDFNTGAKIAFARLMGEEIKTEPAAETKGAQKPALDPELPEFLKLLSDSLDVLERIERLGISK